MKTIRASLVGMKPKYVPLALAALSNLLTAVNPALAQTWTQTSAPNLNWHAVASSADGRKLVAVAGFPSAIVTSTNSGVTWMPTSAPSQNWYSVASSADGTRLAATAVNAGTYLSADSGATWIAVTNGLYEYYTFYYSCLASSADGSKLFLGFYDGVHRAGGMASSTDSGTTWARLTNAPGTASVASSANGTRLLAGGDGLFAISTNSGETWMNASVPSTWVWNAVASSSDGSKLVAMNSDDSGFIYTSKDSGSTWATNNGPIGNWISVASSADGAKLIAAQGGCFNPGGPACGGVVYTSSDSGATWTSNNVPDAFAVASSADGSKLVAVVNGGGIWISQTTPMPVLNIAHSGDNLVLFWVVPSTDFVLQQNSDLTTTNWTDVTNTPTLNLTNLRHEVVVATTNAHGFYRLKR